MKIKTAPKNKFVSTTNACKLCRPMGAAIAFRGVENAVPFLHGSQGCATYMRRYIISHFNEPIDIASSSLGEKNAVFGGGPNLKLGLDNVSAKYKPSLVGVATTCLTETIGDDAPGLIKEYFRERSDKTDLPELVNVSTPSYSGTHMEGFHGAVQSIVEQLADENVAPHDAINLLPGFVSPSDIRYLKEVMADFGRAATILPDISETLDGPALREYPLIPPGGTPLKQIHAMGGAKATIEFGPTLDPNKTTGTLLEQKHGVKNHLMGLPMGINETDAFFRVLELLTGKPTPERHQAERDRLVDAYVDGHKYVSGKRAVIYGEEDLVVGLTALLAEFGIHPVLCASGGNSGRLKEAIQAVTKDILPEQPLIREGHDFYEIAALTEELKPDLLVGHSKGYPMSRKLDIPIIRLGFPIHDRLGGQRLLHLGYRGAQQIFDLIANAMIQKKQDRSSVGYSYM
ncbi:MAG: nitrogenase [Desulfobulbaceae bacterium]|nr:nitrogenase [Desulfobulbaceae bacterium]